MNRRNPHAPTAGPPDPGGSRGAWRAVLFLVSLAAMAGLWFGGLKDFASLDALKAREAELRALVADRWMLALALYAATYALSTLALTPGTLWLSILGGFLFGPAVSAPATLAGGALGAFGVFWLARSSLRGWIEQRAGPAVRRFEEGFSENAVAWMLALRLMPVVPYPVANLAPSLMGARFRDFAATTLVGLIPSITLYALIGGALSRALAEGREVSVAGLAGDFAPLFFAAGLIALAPIAYKEVIRRRRKTASLAPDSGKPEGGR